MLHKHDHRLQFKNCNHLLFKYFYPNLLLYILRSKYCSSVILFWFWFSTYCVRNDVSMAPFSYLTKTSSSSSKFWLNVICSQLLVKQKGLLPRGVLFLYDNPNCFAAFKLTFGRVRNVTDFFILLLHLMKFTKKPGSSAIVYTLAICVLFNLFP